MTQKEDINGMLGAGKSYDEIEDATGSTRSYIRSIAVEYRKRTPEDETPEPEVEPEDSPTLNFVDDNPKPKKTTDKTGADYHKEWVKAAKYECGSCGATVGRSTTFCPHCGATLIWGEGDDR